MYQWGSSIIASKDAFKEWLRNYLGPDGLKSGVSALYDKLLVWGNIVYEWFRDKFLVFIKNIPDMVKDWKKLRLSLFKWGTFLGGGGGGALWGMFSSFDNWGKLSELMGNEDFTGAVEKFSELVDKNSDAFKDMGEEAMKEILERIMEEPKDAKEIIEELLDEQKEMIKKEQEKNKEKNENKEEEEKQETQLEQEQIKEAFKKSKGSPQSKEEVFGYLIGDSLQTLMKQPYSSFDSSLAHTENKAREAMKEYMKNVREEAKKKTKVGKANQEFLNALGDKEDDLINELAKVASLAIGTGHKDFEQLAKTFEKIMKDKFTVEVDSSEGGDEGVTLDDIVKQKPRR